MTNKTLAATMVVLPWALIGNSPVTADECKEAYTVAAALQNRGLFDDAFDEWQSVIKVCKDQDRLRRAKRYAGICLYQLKKFKEAEEQFQQLLSNELLREKIKPADIRERQDAMLCLAACYLRLKKEVAAASLLAMFEKEFPDLRELAQAVRRGDSPPDESKSGTVIGSTERK